MEKHLLQSSVSAMKGEKEELQVLFDRANHNQSVVEECPYAMGSENLRRYRLRRNKSKY